MDIKSLTLPSRPTAGPFALNVRPGPKSSPGERHVEITLSDGSQPPVVVSARFRDPPSREHLIALQAKDDGAFAADLASLGLIEPNPIPIRLEKAPALICVARGPLLEHVLKAKEFVARPAQGAVVVPADEAQAPSKPRRKTKGDVE